MNKNSITSFYYRALLAPTKGDLAAKTSPAQFKMKIQGQTQHNGREMDYDYMHVSLKIEGNKVIIPSSNFPENLREKLGRDVSLSSNILEKGKTKSGNRVNVDSLLLRSAITKTGVTLVSSPLYQILPLLHNDADSQFYRCDLNVLCRNQFQGGGSDNIRMTRLNVRYAGDLGNGIESMTLFGEDVITSPLFRDMVLSSPSGPSEIAETEHDPFDANSIAVDPVVKRVFIPYSCRLRWNDGSADNAYVNIDRYGNFSFFLRDVQTLELLGEIFAYLDAIKALSITHIHPLLRSDTALQKVTA